MVLSQVTGQKSVSIVFQKGLQITSGDNGLERFRKLHKEQSRERNLGMN